MNRYYLAIVCTLMFSPTVFSQGSDSRFLKRIENNYRDNVLVEKPNGKIDGRYNLDSKTNAEKRFFGDFNAKVEYFVDPSFRPVVGFRIYLDSLDTSYLLEVKTKERKSDTIVSRIIPVSDMFTDSVYVKTINTIETYKAIGKPAMIFDGDMITFRCVVGAEVWTFTIHEPDGKIKKTSDLFRQMIADVEAGTFDEAKYLKMLGDGSL